MVKALKAVDEDILTGPHISMMTVTPTMAKTWLEKNTARNRKVVPGLILKYVEDIRAGRWHRIHKRNRDGGGRQYVARVGKVSAA